MVSVLLDVCKLALCKEADSSACRCKESFGFAHASVGLDVADILCLYKQNLGSLASMSFLSDIRKTVVSAKLYENLPLPNNVLDWPVYNQAGDAITLSNSQGGNLYAASVAVSSAGLTLVVSYRYETEGSLIAVAVYTRENKSASFTLLTTLFPADQVYLNGQSSVAISALGDVIVVGSPSDDEAGAFWVYNYVGGQYVDVTGKMFGPVSEVGHGVAVSADGTVIAIGEPSFSENETNSGAVSVWSFNPSSSTLNFVIYVYTPYEGYSDQGYSVALSADGSVLVAGAPNENSDYGAIYVYTAPTPLAFALTGRYVAPGGLEDDEFGYSVAVSAHGEQIVAGAPENDITGYNDGAVYVFTLQNGGYVAGQKLCGMDRSHAGQQGPQAGHSVAISANGETIAFGGPQDYDDRGAAWVFNRTSVRGWSQNGVKKRGGGQPENENIDDQALHIALSADASTLAVLGTDYDNNAEVMLMLFQ